MDSSGLLILDTYDKTKKWLTEHVHRNIFPSNKEEFQILSDLINRHPSKSEWKNQEPRSFKISRSPGTGALVLYVRFVGLDKYRIVSWVACGKGKLDKSQEPDNIDTKLTSAMRYAIRTQIADYKKTHHDKKCVLCSSEKKIEVDHHPLHFVEIKTNFIEMKTKKNDQVPTDFNWHPKRGNSVFKTGTKENDYYDKKWKQSWQRYHKKYATYRYLCSLCNKKENKKK